MSPANPARVILVTGLGGNVGQGIVRSIRAMGRDLRILGTNTEPVSGGNHLCDAFYVVPYAVDAAYVPTMSDVCRAEGVELIVPSTDYETYHLGLATDHLPPVAVSPPATCLVFLDKLVTAQVFARHAVPFAESCLPSEYRGQFDKVIVKPREGRGSRGIVIDPPDPSAFSDEFVVQRRYEGKEVTTAFYVRLDGTLHGHVTMSRSLTAGMTSACEIDQRHDVNVEAIVQALMKAVVIRGSCNIQSIVTPEGRVVPFEVNGRLSGTTSIRGQLGFPDACWTVQERLGAEPLSPPRVTGGCAVRIMMDVVYPDSRLQDHLDASKRHFVF